MKIFVRVLSERWKSLERESGLMFDVTLLCWYCIDVSVCMKINPNHLVISSCRYYLTE